MRGAALLARHTNMSGFLAREGVAMVGVSVHTVAVVVGYGFPEFFFSWRASASL